MNPFIVVAMDGGAATGKSSSSKIISEKYNWMHIDTGSHYRTVTRALIDQGLSVQDLPTKKLDDTIKSLEPSTKIVADRVASLMINERLYQSEHLRSEKVNNVVSDFAAEPIIRYFLLNYQRNLVPFAKENGYSGIVMEGRDIGSVVLPDAHLRFFLHADLDARKKRRENEGIADEVEKRDKMDSSRKVAPLVCVNGAISIDSGIHSLDEVVQIICDKIEEYPS